MAQLYRDRADCENAFDELKNQWGWGGFTTQDLARCRLTARMVALVYNWWNIFVRLAEPDKHLEAITSRPLLLAGIAERTTHGRQTTLKITSTHGRAGWAERVLVLSKTGKALRRREVPARADRYCGAVDVRPKMVANPGARRPILAERPPIARSAPPDGAGVTPEPHTTGLKHVAKIRDGGRQLPFLG